MARDPLYQPARAGHKEIGRRFDLVGIFPNAQSDIRLAGAQLLEQNDEWLVQRRYMSVELLAVVLAEPGVIHDITVEELSTAAYPRTTARPRVTTNDLPHTNQQVRRAREYALQRGSTCSLWAVRVMRICRAGAAARFDDLKQSTEDAYRACFGNSLRDRLAHRSGEAAGCARPSVAHTLSAEPDGPGRALALPRTAGLARLK